MQEACNGGFETLEILHTHNRECQDDLENMRYPGEGSSSALLGQ